MADGSSRADTTRLDFMGGRHVLLTSTASLSFVVIHPVDEISDTSCIRRRFPSLLLIRSVPPACSLWQKARPSGRAVGEKSVVPGACCTNVVDGMCSVVVD